jgi:RimJ/RimL family protein N-acetyltransferase
MTLARSTERLETERLVLRRVVLGDLPFYVRIHGTPEVAQGLWPEGRPRTAEQTEGWLRYTLASYDALALGYLAVVRKADGALIGRCGLMDMAVEARAPDRRVRRG